MSGPSIVPHSVDDVTPIPAYRALWKLQAQIEAAVMWHTNPHSVNAAYCQQELTAALAKASTLIELLCAS